MIKQISVLVFLVLFVWGWFFWINNLGDTSQLETQPLSRSPEKKTVVYAGEYGYNNPALTEEDEKGNIISMGPYGSILVYPETDNTISF